MKTKFVYPLLMVSVLAFSPFVSAAKDTTPAKETTAQVKKDGVAIAWVEAIDNFEIKVSQLALDKKVEGNVKDFADMLHSDHSKNLDEVKSLSNDINEKPVETADLKSFKKDGEKDYKKLSGKDEKDFPKAFIDAMVKGHEGAVKKVDHLIKETKNEKLKPFLTETRKMIEHHLEQAKEIQKSMKA